MASMDLAKKTCKTSMFGWLPNRGPVYAHPGGGVETLVTSDENLHRYAYPGPTRLPLKFNPTKYYDRHRYETGSRSDDSSSASSDWRHLRQRRTPTVAVMVAAVILLLLLIGICVYFVRQASSTAIPAESLVPVTTTTADVSSKLVLNQTFIPQYNDPNSAEYQTLAKTLCNETGQVYADQNVTTTSCAIQSFSAGSVIAVIEFKCQIVVRDGQPERTIPDLQTAVSNSPHLAAQLDVLLSGGTNFRENQVTNQKSSVVYAQTTTNGQVIIHDACANNPCEQSCATNANSVSSYTCSCYSGWTLQADGKSCLEVNECTSSPCQNQAQCVDEKNSYSCTCQAGWSGTNCQTDTNECASNPCQNGATCTDRLNGYTCTCATGWTGTTCGTNPDNCQGVTCQNGGTCVDGLGSYTCTCVAAYTGTHCENDVNECNQPVSTACTVGNRGTCQNTAGSWTCTCATGFYGDLNCNYDYCPNRADCLAEVPTGSTTAQMYPFGTSAGDTRVLTTQGYETPPVSTMGMLTFFNTEYPYLRISTDGLVWLSNTGYDVVITVLNQCMTGLLNHRTDFNTAVLDTATAHVCAMLTQAPYSELKQSPCSFRANYAMVITWENMTPNSGGTASATFQLVIASNSILTYGIYIYSTVGFSESNCELKAEENVGFLSTVTTKKSCCNIPYVDLGGDLKGLPARSNVGVKGMYVMSFNFLPKENATIHMGG